LPRKFQQESVEIRSAVTIASWDTGAYIIIDIPLEFPLYDVDID
jgi:hypothetical protein